jgi:hypothetical protein
MEAFIGIIFRDSSKRQPPGPNQVIQTAQDLDRFVFEGLRFSAKEKGVFSQMQVKRQIFPGSNNPTFSS